MTFITNYSNNNQSNNNNNNNNNDNNNDYNWMIIAVVEAPVNNYYEYDYNNCL